MKTYFFVLVGLLWSSQLFAQNVGIGTTNPIDNLHIHSSSVSAGITLTNQFSGMNILNVVRIGYRYEGANAGPDANYFFYNLPSTVPFVINQGFLPRFTIGSAGNVGIGMAPYNFATLNVNGPGYFFAKSNQGAFVSATDSSTAPTLNGSGFGASKRLSTGLNFINLLMRGDKPQAYIEANFKNGTANQRSSMVVFDSLGNVGIGSYVFDSALQARLHVFGNQRIQSNGGAVLTLNGETGNYSNSSSELRLQYTPIVGLRAPSGQLFGSSPLYYFMRIERPGTSTSGGDLNIGLHTSVAIGDDIGYTALSQNTASQVGIRRRPDRSLSDSIKVDVEGFTRINGGLVLSGTGQPTGSLLIADASGIARLRRPTTLVVDNTNNGVVSYEFRNGGTYRGALGWDQAAGRFFFFDGESNTNTMFINNGRLGIQRDPTTNALEVNGTASKSSAGDWIPNSDERLKKNIASIQSPLQKLLQLKGITYEWNDQQTGMTRPTGTHMGFTAQNVQAVFPQLVSKDAQGYLQTSYGTYDALYVEAIRELVEKINHLEAQVQKLSTGK